MNISPAGKNIIKEFEGLRLKAYLCSASVWSIGYGHTRNVKRGDVINESQADCFLMQDLYLVEQQINTIVRVKLTQRQYDALCSLIFNIGVYHFSKSTLLAKLNSGDYIGAAMEFKRWNKACVKGKLTVLTGLIRRRQKEEALFMLDLVVQR